jgi:hypothetical protein
MLTSIFIIKYTNFHKNDVINLITSAEKEKSNFSGNYSEAFKELPTIGLYTLKYTEKKLD